LGQTNTTAFGKGHANQWQIRLAQIA